jgi:hypothetical protein
MASPLPDPLRLREIKYGERTPPEERSKVARAMLEAGRAAEALDLFLLAGDDAAAGEIREEAVREGRPALLLMFERAQRPVPAAQWKAAAEAAFAAGRLREAFRCFQKAGHEDGLARVRERLPGYEIYVPQGK